MGKFSLLVAVLAVLQMKQDGAVCEPLSKVLLEDSINMGAACLDGTPPGYYMRAGSGDGTNKWVLHVQGGGWCASIEECYTRTSTAVGSSKSWPQFVEYSGMLSDVEAINPDFYNWNAVYLMYCDGGSFAGNKLEPDEHEGQLIYYRGYRNLQAILGHLVDERGLSSATDVIFSGCSAGGLAVYLHTNYVKTFVPDDANYAALPDAGYFIEMPGVVELDPDEFKSMMVLQNINEAIIPACREEHESDIWKCLFAPYIYKYISAPTYVLNSRMDIYVVLGVLISPNSSVTIAEYPEEFDSQAKSVIFSPSSGYFLNSCFTHCQSVESGWNDRSIGDYTIAQSFANWYFNSNPESTRLKDSCNYPCNPSCTLF